MAAAFCELRNFNLRVEGGDKGRPKVIAEWSDERHSVRSRTAGLSTNDIDEQKIRSGCEVATPRRRSASKVGTLRSLDQIRYNPLRAIHSLRTLPD